MGLRLCSLVLFLSVSSLFAQFGENPFSVSAKLEKAAGDRVVLAVDYKVPKGLHLTKSSIKVTAQDAVLTPLKIPEGVRKMNPALGTVSESYDNDFQATYLVSSVAKYPLKVSVDYQGCKDEMCFMPQTTTFSLSLAKMPGGDMSATRVKDAKADGQTDDVLKGFTIVGSDMGYKKVDDFMAFLDRVESGNGIEKNPLKEMFAKRGVIVLILFILLGGLALNLTPCVLPMIPINIAIIGAGAQAGSRARGFALGAVYGLGIALAYGTLGLVVVLTGSQFGTLNSSPWFNLAIAIIFTLLALALFGVFRIDFSKFQSTGPNKKSRGPFVTAFVFGGLAALLAGACIAPVLIWVLLFSTEIYRHGNVAGLLLPFILGMGMALPWPFAGAGLSFLPKPGKWMENINRVFGVIILLAAIYYGWLGVKLLKPAPDKHSKNELISWHTSLDEALDISSKTGQPVFIDVWATWCKSCELMSATTLKDPQVAERLNKYVPLKFQAEDPKDPATKRVLQALGVKGQPFFVILKPVKVHH